MPDVEKKWEFDFIKENKIENKGILLFNKRTASILTTTGDYRYLSPEMEGENLILRGFDGVFAFKLVGKLEGDYYEGTFYAGKSHSQPFRALVNSTFSLKDPHSFTQYNGDITEVILPTMNKKKIPVVQKGKVNIIQIFGSWCPNCIDETRFLSEWYQNENPDKVHVAMIAFERSLMKNAL
jgi:hypothetical protein